MKNIPKSHLKDNGEVFISLADSLTLPKNFDKKLICKSCIGILINPHRCNSCKKAFCKTCIKFEDSANICPSCNNQ